MLSMILHISLVPRLSLCAGQGLEMRLTSHCILPIFVTEERAVHNAATPIEKAYFWKPLTLG